MTPPEDSLSALPALPAAVRQRWLLHVGLFLVTCASTTVAGMANAGSLAGGLMFAGTLIAILLSHEMGHYLMARRHGVETSLPYFIPLPLGIGTLGAVIKMRGRIPSRDALVNIGAAGPIAGLLVAIPMLILGVYLSPVGASPAGGMQEGNSLLYILVKLALKGAYLPSGGQDIGMHPIAFAGWVGILVTFINLIPIGQLDGGHVAYGVLGHERHDRFSAWLHRALAGAFLLVAGALTWMAHVGHGLSWRDSALHGASSAAPWLVWTLMIWVMRRFSGGSYHPAIGGGELSVRRRRLAVWLLVVFVLVLTPVPMREVLP